MVEGYVRKRFDANKAGTKDIMGEEEEMWRNIKKKKKEQSLFALLWLSISSASTRP